MDVEQKSWPSIPPSLTLSSFSKSLVVRLPSPLESLGDSALVGLLSGFLDCLPLCLFYFPPLWDFFAFPLAILNATAPHRLEVAVLLLPLKSILNETVLNRDAASIHFDPCIQGHFVIFMVFSAWLKFKISICRAVVDALLHCSAWGKTHACEVGVYRTILVYSLKVTTVASKVRYFLRACNIFLWTALNRSH